MLQLHHGCRLDVRPDPAAAVGVRCGRVGRALGRGDQLGRAIALERALGSGRLARRVRLARPVRFTGGLGIRRALGIGRTVRDAVAILRTTGLTAADRDPMEDDLVTSGRFVRIEARGERTGLPRSVTVGFVEDTEPPPGALLVAAGATDSAWARNLLADPSCRVTVGDRTFDAVAEPLDGAEHARAIRELILRYGTPAEGLGHGPSFRLRPLGPATR